MKRSSVKSFRSDAKLGIRTLALMSDPPPLSSRPGLPATWEPTLNVYAGVANLATGNLTLTQATAGWSGLGPSVSFTLYANSSADLQTGLGPHWRHAYSARIDSAGSLATFTRSDGRQINFTLASGSYVPEAGYDEKLVHNGDGTWALSYKDGSLQTFSAAGQLASQADADGNASTLTYTSGNLTSVTDALGRSLTVNWNGGRISGVTDAESRTWSFLYTGNNLTRVNEPTLYGQIYGTVYGYDTSGRPSSVTNRLGKTWTYTYGSDGTFLYVVDSAGRATGQSTTAQSPQDPGFAVQAQGTMESPDVNPNTYPSGTLARVYVEDAGHNPVEYGIDASGRLTGNRDGSGNQTNLQYDAGNNVVTRGAPDGTTTNWTFDARRNVLGSTDATNRSVTQTWSAGNDLLTRIDASGTTTNTYDGEHHKLTSTDPTNRTTTYVYKANGMAESLTDGAGKVTVYGYDANSNLNSITTPSGEVTSFVYALNRVVSRTDARNRTTQYGYDTWNRQVSVTYPQSANQSFSYDAENRVVQAIDGTGTRTYTYDDLGRKTDQTDPRGSTHAVYDDASRLLSQTDVSGRLIQYGYDSRNLMTQVSDPSSSVSYVYDSNGRISTASYSNGLKSSYTYDAAGRVTLLSHKQGFSSTVASYTSTYDAAGRMQQVQEVTASGNAATTYGYDAANRLTSENRTGVTPYASSYTYNSRGLRATALRSDNGTVSHNGTYSYDDAGRLSNVADTAVGSTVGGSYTYNGDGTLASYPGPGYTRKLDYDEEGRLISVSKQIGSTLTPLTQYGYGFDGGRRWKKDLTAGTWDWFPCGVACCAGDLMELRSTNGGVSWQTTSTSLQSSRGLVARDGVTYLADLRGAFQTLVSNGSVTRVSVSDNFGVVRSKTGTLTSPYYDGARLDAEDLTFTGQSVVLRQVSAPVQVKPAGVRYSEKECDAIYDNWKGKNDRAYQVCMAACSIPIGIVIGCAIACFSGIGLPVCLWCLGVGTVVGGACVTGCLHLAGNRGNTASEWYLRCLKQAAKPAVTR